MAQSTFSPSSRAWNPDAPLAPAGAALRRIARAARLPWLLAAVIVTGATVGVLALEVSKADLEQQRAGLVAENAAREESVRAAESANILERIRTADLRSVLAVQADQLSSTEGFLK